jgi:hypothetical protein
MEKRVDESWKEQVDREKRSSGTAHPEFVKGERFRPSTGSGRTDASAAFSQGPSLEERSAGEGTGREFSMFLSSLSMQVMMALGELPNPMTQERQEDLEQARYLIDVLGMLQAKTKGNLTGEEAKLLDGVLYELRMKYVSKTQGTPL